MAMKRSLSVMMSSLLSLALLAAGPVSAYADNNENDNSIRSGKEATNSGVLKEHFIDSGTLAPLKRLDLDTVLKLALDYSLNYKLLTFKITALKENEGNLKEQKKKLDESASGGTGDSFTLPESLEEIQKKYEDFPEELLPSLYPMLETNAAVNRLISGIGSITDAMNKQLQGQRDQLILSLKQINIEQANTLLDLEEARIGIRLQMTSQYVELLTLKKQVSMNEAYLDVLKTDVKRAELMQEQGMTSAEKVTEAQREVEKQEQQLTQLRNKYRLALAQLCLDLGVAYDPDIELGDLGEFSPQPVTQMSRERILEKSFEMKRKWNSIILAEQQKSHTDATNEDQKDYLEINVRIAEQQAEKTRIDLNKKVDQLYSNQETAYQAYQNALKDLNHAQLDVQHITVRYNNALVSRHDYEKSSFSLTQQEAQLELARLQLYVAQRAVDALEDGFIM